MTGVVNLWAALNGNRQSASLRGEVSELAASFGRSQAQMDVLLDIVEGVPEVQRLDLIAA